MHLYCLRLLDGSGGEEAVARVAEVFDDVLGLSVTPGAVDVLEGRQCAPK
jgi:hypothetical protein